MIKYEVRPAVRRMGRVKLVSYNELDQHTGFRSMFGFDEDTVNLIKDNNSTAGLEGIPIYGDEVLIDFDDEYEAADELAETLREKGIGFRK